MGTLVGITPEKIVQLCGLNPRESLLLCIHHLLNPPVITVCGKAMDFYQYQLETSKNHDAQIKRNEIRQVQQLEAAFAEKMRESQTKLETIKAHYEALSRELEMSKQSTADMRAKYLEVSRQKRKLEELYESTKGRVGTSVPHPVQSPQCFSRAEQPQPIRRNPVREPPHTPSLGSIRTAMQPLPLLTPTGTPRSNRASSKALQSPKSFTSSNLYQNRDMVRSPSPISLSGGSFSRSGIEHAREQPKIQLRSPGGRFFSFRRK